MGKVHRRLERLDDNAGVDQFARFASGFGGPWNFLGGCAILVVDAVMLGLGHYDAVGPLTFIGVVAVITGLAIGPKGMVRSWFRRR